MLNCGVVINKKQISWGVALVLAAALISYFSFPLFQKEHKEQHNDNHKYATYSSPAGERRTVKLPDSSMVMLGANSVLKVPKDYNKSSRFLILMGAAYIEATTNAGFPLTIEAADMKVTVLGTSFFIRAYPYESGQLAELIKGKLKVEKAYHSTLENTPEILGPGEMVMLNKSVDLIEKETFQVSEREKWIKGDLKFDQLSLYALTRLLEEWYGLPFEVRNNEKPGLKFSGDYNNQSLDQVLKDICKTASCSYSIDKEKVILEF